MHCTSLCEEQFHSRPGGILLPRLERQCRCNAITGRYQACARGRMGERHVLSDQLLVPKPRRAIPLMYVIICALRNNEELEIRVKVARAAVRGALDSCERDLQFGDCG